MAMPMISRTAVEVKPEKASATDMMPKKAIARAESRDVTETEMTLVA